MFCSLNNKQFLRQCFWRWWIRWWWWWWGREGSFTRSWWYQWADADILKKNVFKPGRREESSNYRVLATDYETFSIEYQCLPLAGSRRDGKGLKKLLSNHSMDFITWDLLYQRDLSSCKSWYCHRIIAITNIFSERIWIFTRDEFPQRSVLRRYSPILI